MALNLSEAALAALLNGPEVRAEIERRNANAVRQAKALVGKRTLRLHDSIDSDVRRDDEGLYGVVGSDVWYALFHELDNPYLRGSIDAAK